MGYTGAMSRRRSPRREAPTDPVPVIADSGALADFCAGLAGAAFITIDTEFMRESTYWPTLCLIQIAGPKPIEGGAEEDNAAVIDALADGLDLAPVWQLLADPATLKVLHAARQDMEIFLKMAGRLPTPIFDTQVAAMVLGYGDQVGYDNLVRAVTGAEIDKSSRMVDWSRRPLADKHLRYALGDVTHLREVYATLRDKLAESGRLDWIGEEVTVLTDPATYTVEPHAAWHRIKHRGGNRRFLGQLRAAAAWRELFAQAKNLPRQRVLRDDSLIEIAANPPTSAEQLEAVRGVGKGFARSAQGKALLEAVAEAAALPEDDLPRLERKKFDGQAAKAAAPIAELMKVLLKGRCEAAGVAPKLVASAADVDALARGDDADVPALHGWRFEVFGRDALALKRGELALAIVDGKIEVLPRDGA